MPALKLLKLLALASLAILALSSLQVNALAADRAQVARHIRDHDAVAKRRRSDTSGSGCKPRTTSSLPPSPTSAPATSTPAPTTSSAAPASTSVARSRKWGLAWDIDPSYLNNFALRNVGYLYTWSHWIPYPIPNGIVAIPMLWGPNDAALFQNNVVQGYASYVLGMNEPNMPSQSNMSGADGADLWIQYMNPLRALGYHLISPACTNDETGKLWYLDFFAACVVKGGCYVDSMAFHAYTTNASDLIEFANYLHDTYHMDVWITEFADQNNSGTGGQATMDQVWEFAGTVFSFVESTPWVTAAFPFGVVGNFQGFNDDNALIGSDGQPTALAAYYFDHQD